jgi:hypothetical protein
MVCFYNGRKKFWDGKGNVSKIKKSQGLGCGFYFARYFGKTFKVSF